MPTIFVINGDFSPFVTQLAGICTVALSLIQAGAMMHLILERDPLAVGGAQVGKISLNGAAKSNGIAKLNGMAHMKPTVYKT